MKHLLTLLIVAALASATFTETSLAQDDATKKKGGEQVTRQIKKTKMALKSLTLTTEQETTLDKAAEKLVADIADLEQKGLTQEMRKARSEKLKAGRESGLSGKALKAHGLKDLSAEEVELFEASAKYMMAFQKTVAKMLTDEQMSALPKKPQKKMKMLAKEKGSKGGKKKKMKAEDEGAAVEGAK